MELIVAILFFSLASTVCIQLFARSHKLSRQTVNQNRAVIQAQNLAEIFFAADGDVAQMKNMFPANAADTADNTFVIYLNPDWEECETNVTRYIAKLTAFSENDDLIEADIVVYESDSESEPLYTLHLKHHVAERRGNLE